MPEARLPERQSVFAFGMYRSGSSVLEAISLALAKHSGLTPINLMGNINAAGVAIVDSQDYSRNDNFIEANADSLVSACRMGGYLHYGFREVPHEFSKKHTYIGASFLLARDPREILISQYSAVRKHATEGASGIHILKLREIIEKQNIEDFVTSPDSINFAKRIVESYRPMIAKGMRVYRYEGYFNVDGKFDIVALARSIARDFDKYLSIPDSKDALAEEVRHITMQSQGLARQVTSGKKSLLDKLPVESRNYLNEALGEQLHLLGYS